ncbi:hypothetical protein HPB49_003113 [Dermacentor silvarum]|uniref:Uncharacterized protein n=1 Tax=Dermacentor silvarum TaxID=543639 RepID=A0ACB8DT36_DERSI|nr:hypothetical protein HPB49_003113 [Dermacentor silvarum]
MNVVTQDGTPIPHVQTLRVLGLHLQDLNRNNVTVAKQLPRDVLQRLRVPPLPKHIYPQVHQERRISRATALTKGHANDPRAYYVDVAKYPHRPNTYAAAVIAADTGVITTRGVCNRTGTSDPGLPHGPQRLEAGNSQLCYKQRPWNHCKSMFNDSKTGNQRYRQVVPCARRELDAGPNRNEETDTEAHALTIAAEPQRPDAEDEEYSITTYGDVLLWYRTSRRLYPPPHRDLQRSEAATVRQLQVKAIWTPVWAKHVCPEVDTTDICQHCKKARATQRYLLWDCAPPPGNQEEPMPTAISSKIISREPGNQRDVVQHVLSILERQRPKAAPPRV